MSKLSRLRNSAQKSDGKLNAKVAELGCDGEESDKPIDREALIRQLAGGRAEEADADLLLYSGGINDDNAKSLIGLVRSRENLRTNVILMLRTNGGSADAAFRIARHLQMTYERVTLFIQSMCKSAGTLIALGADEIVMADSAEMGPLDVQLGKTDELFESLSGLTPGQAFLTLQDEALKSFEGFFLALRTRSGFQITTRTAAEIATKLTTGLFGPVYAQIDPMRLGEVQRAMMIAGTYGNRLERGNVKPGTIAGLLMDYPCHEFVIDRTEAMELFNCVRCPTAAEALLGDIYEQKCEDEYHSGLVAFLNEESNDDPQRSEAEHAKNAPSEHVSSRAESSGGGASREAHEFDGDGAGAAQVSSHAASANN